MCMHACVCTHGLIALMDPSVAQVEERVATIGSSESAEASIKLVAACVRMLWPGAMPGTPVASGT